jgi:hypothetical protein
MFDIDTLNQMHAEERAYREWVNKEANKALGMASYKRKQARWNELFPPMPCAGLSLEEMTRPY